MNPDDIRLLELNGWTVECMSPFEISTDDGGFAKGYAAQMILRTIQEEDRERQSRIRLLEERDEALLSAIVDSWTNRQKELYVGMSEEIRKEIDELKNPENW